MLSLQGDYSKGACWHTWSSRLCKPLSVRLSLPRESCMCVSTPASYSTMSGLKQVSTEGSTSPNTLLNGTQK